jgi:hypothetical protein
MPHLKKTHVFAFSVCQALNLSFDIFPLFSVFFYLVLLTRNIFFPVSCTLWSNSRWTHCSTNSMHLKKFTETIWGHVQWETTNTQVRVPATQVSAAMTEVHSLLFLLQSPKFLSLLGNAINLPVSAIRWNLKPHGLAGRPASISCPKTVL